MKLNQVGTKLKYELVLLSKHLTALYQEIKILHKL